MKNWDIKIYRGILTGYNEAFIINQETRDKLVAASSKNEEIIRPILRGRDIQKYSNEYANLWLIYIPWHFPFHNDSTIKGVSFEAEKEFKLLYPAIYEHLLNYKIELSQRNKSETGVRYEWYALQRFGSNYMEDFFRPKIIFPNMTKFMPFFYDCDGYFINDKGFIITGHNIAFLMAFLNSSLFKFCFKESFPELQGGTRELRKIFFDKIPVIEITKEQNQIFERKIIEIQKLKTTKKDTLFLEKELDELIFDLYNLTSEERLSVGFIVI